MRKYKGILFLAFTIIISLTLIRCGDDDENESINPGENEVFMSNTSFVPSSLSVEEGTTVTWINKDNINHTTTNNDDLWDSGTMGRNETFSYTFDSTGTFNYRCTLHPAQMTGVIIVGEGGSAAGTGNGNGGGY